MEAIKSIKPTESELEILQVLWAKGHASVREVHENLAAFKDVGYTTTLKLMQIMNEKGLVKRNDAARTHIYKAAINKEATQQNLLGKIIRTLFSGSPSQLVLQALGSGDVSEEEISQIQKMLDDLKKK